MKIRVLMILVSGLLLSSLLFAQGSAVPPVSAVVTGGALSISDGGGSLDFATTLDGTDQAINATGTPPVLTLTDARGLRPIDAASGWNVTLQMTDLVDTTDGTFIIPAASMTFTTTGGSIARIAGQGGANVPTVVPFTGSIGTAQKIVTADVGEGRGTYTYTTVLSQYTLTIPAETIADTYAGTLTATISATP